MMTLFGLCFIGVCILLGCGMISNAIRAREKMNIFKEIKIGKYVLRFYPSDTGWMCGISKEMMEALEKVLNAGDKNE